MVRRPTSLWRKAVARTAFAALATTLAAAAFGRTPTAGEATSWAVPEVVVRAAAPRFWKLTRGASSVYVLGTVEPLPAGLAWNSAPVAKAMDGANRLILPPMVEVGIWGGLQALQASHQPHGVALDAQLSPELQARLHAVLVRLHRKPDDLQNYKPGWAAFDLERAIRSSGVTSDDEPAATLRKLANAKRVPIKPSGRHDAGPMLKELADMPQPQGVAALTLAVAAVEHQLENAPAIGRAWASGNLADLREVDGPSARLSTLLKMTPSGQAGATRATDDIVSAIHAALALPGTSVTSLDLHDLARTGGAIDRLRAEGVQVIEPLD